MQDYTAKGAVIVLMLNDSDQGCKTKNSVYSSNPILSKNRSNQQDSLLESFKRLHSLPFGADFFQLVKESRKLGIEYRQYQKLYRTWEKEQTRKPILKRERQLEIDLGGGL